MKKILTLFASLAMLVGCSSSTKQDNYHKISASEAKEMMDHQEVIIVDVRGEDEYAMGHIEGAIVIPNETINKTEIKQLNDKEATILIYCHSGNRSRQAAKKFVKMGYKNIYDFGGIIDWPYETVR